MSNEKVIIDVDKVFEVCNASLNSALRRHCPIKNSMPCLDTCLCCGDTKCFDSWREQNKLWGIPDEQSVRELRDIQSLKCKPCVVTTVQKQTVRSDGPRNGRLF